MRLTKPSFRVVALSTVVTGLVACAAVQMTPTWEAWSSSSNPATSYETLQELIYDPAGAVISAGHASLIGSGQDTLVVMKNTANGAPIWRTVVDLGEGTYNRPWASALGTDGSIYLVTESTLIKFTSNGTESWRRNISTLINGDAALRDVEISGNRLYVAGRDLYVFDLNGALTNTVAQIAPLWDVAITTNGIYAAGTGQVHRYTTNLAPVWKYALPVVQNPPADMAIANDGTVYVATFNSTPQDSAYLTRISSNGTQVWSKFFADPDANSYQLSGIPNVELLPDGNVVFGVSQQPTRIINIINASNGSVKTSNKQSTGLIDEMVVDSKGGIYVVGSNKPQKFDNTATLLATGTMPSTADISSGGLAVTASSIYVGAGVFKNNDMKMYVSRYANQ